MSSVAHYHDVGSITQTSCELCLCTRPPALFFLDSEMHGSAFVSPGVITVVQIIESPAVARNSANFPVVSAEMKWLCRGEGHRPNPFENIHGDDGAALCGSHIHRRRRAISRLNQERGVLEPQMR